MALRAVIMCPPSWMSSCFAYCRRRGYVVVDVINDMNAWADVLTITRTKEAEVVVISSHDHVDPNRVPRLESITEEIPRLDGSSEAPDGHAGSQ